MAISLICILVVLWALVVILADNLLYEFRAPEWMVEGSMLLVVGFGSITAGVIGYQLLWPVTLVGHGQGLVFWLLILIALLGGKCGTNFISRRLGHGIFANQRNVA